MINDERIKWLLNLRAGSCIQKQQQAKKRHELQMIVYKETSTNQFFRIFY